MKNSLKKFFLLGLAVAAAAVAVTQAPKIKKAIDELVRKRKLSKQEGTSLHTEIVEVLRNKSKRIPVKRNPKKKAVKKIVNKISRKAAKSASRKSPKKSRR